jgi:hypothetical protein
MERSGTNQHLWSRLSTAACRQNTWPPAIHAATEGLLISRSQVRVLPGALRRRSAAGHRDAHRPGTSDLPDGRHLTTIDRMFRGRLLTESLRAGVDIAVPDLRLIRIGRHDVSGSVSASQPEVWTFVDFELPGTRVDQLASVLTQALLPEDGWYADYQSTTEHVVVFSGRSFRYRKGDTAARAEAVAFGRAAGTPEHQLDWGD